MRLSPTLQLLWRFHKSRAQHVSMATTPTGPGSTVADIRASSGNVCRSFQSEACYAVASFVVVGTLPHLPLVYLPHRWHLPVVAVSVLHCKASSTLNMSLLRLSHAKRWGERGRGSKEVGKLLRRQIPPLFDALMLIHSERTSCLSAYTATLLCFSLFPGLLYFASPPASLLPSTLFSPSLP